jgi:hypothetical protein
VCDLEQCTTSIRVRAASLTPPSGCMQPREVKE